MCEEGHGRLIGAGVLPVFVTPSGQVSFLLGQEAHVPNWSGSLQWSAFSGASKAGESERCCAAREFAEETMGILGTREAVKQALAHFDVRVVIVRELRPMPVMRVIFVKRFPLEAAADLEMRFAAGRAHLLAVESIGAQVRLARARFPAAYPFLIEGDRLQRPGVRDSVLHVLEADARGPVLRAAVQLASGLVLRLAFTGGAAAAASAYSEWFAKRRQLEEVLRDQLSRDFAHAISVQRDTRGALLGARIQRDWLEKCRIRLVSLEEVEHIMHTGILDGSEMRPSFTPVLHAVCEEFGGMRCREGEDA